MKNSLSAFLMLTAIIAATPARGQKSVTEKYDEPYRPQEHFSPMAHWINDPNGMVYFDNTYHLFYQYFPGGIVWGPMHWGHAISHDLVHWKELPIALYPDKLGYIFSGSAIVDSNNTSGFGRNGRIPLIAIFTLHDPKGEKAGTSDFQTQGIAYSLDKGYSWTKYSKNPVLKNPGVKDFRDPKVMWFAASHRWIMTLATKDRITFYSSPNLKDWKKESEFGQTLGAHGGVWECPDLFALTLNGKRHWVLTVNVNPGGPNGGSATQYFTGQFNGSVFVPDDGITRWADYGPDEYAGVTWNNTSSSRIFLGWMSNWLYANQLPTKQWRNAMTFPRALCLKHVKNQLLLSAMPVNELDEISQKPRQLSNPALGNMLHVPSRYVLKLTAAAAHSFSVVLSNEANEKLIFGFDRVNNRYYIDRSRSGKVDFNPVFAKKAYAPRLSDAAAANLELLVDDSSVEVFADGGLTVMTSLFFPSQPFTRLQMSGQKEAIAGATLTPLTSIWKK